MKRLIYALALLFLSLNVSAQYKKASFFGKDGRTYEMGTQLNIMNGGRQSPFAVKLGLGRDRDGRRYFFNWDFQYLFPYKYSYETSNQSNQKYQVNGQTTGMFLYTLNYSFHFIKDELGEKRIRPYGSIGLGLVIPGGIRSETFSPDNVNGDLKMETQYPEFGGFVGAGLGCLFGLSDKWRIKFQSGYNYAGMASSDDEYSDNLFKVYKSHPYVSLGLQLRVVKD